MSPCTSAHTLIHTQLEYGDILWNYVCHYKLNSLIIHISTHKYVQDMCFVNNSYGNIHPPHHSSDHNGVLHTHTHAHWDISHFDIVSYRQISYGSKQDVMNGGGDIKRDIVLSIVTDEYDDFSLVDSICQCMLHMIFHPPTLLSIGCLCEIGQKTSKQFKWLKRLR